MSYYDGNYSKNYSTKDILFTIFCWLVGIIVGMFTIGIGLRWSELFPKESLSDYFIMIPVIVSGCICIAGFFWAIIMAIIYAVMYELD